MNTPPRFTEDEIAQMNREAIQIYHAENLRLAEKVAALEVQLLQWQELGARLVTEFDIGAYDFYDEKFISFLGRHRSGGREWVSFGEKVDKRLYDVLKRLLELVNATAQGE